MIKKYKDWCYKYVDKLYDWVHENPKDIEQVSQRAMFVAGMPIIIGELVMILVLFMTFIF